MKVTKTISEYSEKWKEEYGSQLQDAEFDENVQMHLFHQTIG